MTISYLLHSSLLSSISSLSPLSPLPFSPLPSIEMYLWYHCRFQETAVSERRRNFDHRSILVEWYTKQVLVTLSFSLLSSLAFSFLFLLPLLLTSFPFPFTFLIQVQFSSNNPSTKAWCTIRFWISNSFSEFRSCYGEDHKIWFQL